MKHIISLGAGVQSSTMALMAAHGEITPMPDCAIFADTQAEPASVYRWLDWLETKLPFPVHRVTAGNLAAMVTTAKPRKDGTGFYVRSSLPAYTLGFDGSKGIGSRGCTYDFKVAPLVKKQRELGGIQRGQKTIGITTWLGISLDEATRMRSSREAWIEHRYPLIELQMRRNGCLEWMKAQGYPQPPRSACVFCPYHRDHEWRRLRDEEPEAFQTAIEFETAFQEARSQTKAYKAIPYLHDSRIPLAEVDFSTAEERGQLNLFENECEGMCGV